MIDQHQAYQCRDKKQERAFPLLKDQEEEKQCRAFEQDQLIILRPQSVPLLIKCQQTDTHRTAKYERSFPSSYFPVFHTVQKHCRKITEKWQERNQRFIPHIQHPVKSPGKYGNCQKCHAGHRYQPFPDRSVHDSTKQNRHQNNRQSHAVSAVQ